MKLHIWVSVCVSCYRAVISGTKPEIDKNGNCILPAHRRHFSHAGDPSCNTTVGFLQHFVVNVEPQIEKAEEFAVERYP